MYKKSELREYIIKCFLITIVTVSLVENVVSYVVNQLIFPAMKTMQDSVVNVENITLKEIIFFMIMATIHTGLRMLGRIMPGGMQGAIVSVSDELKEYIYMRFPSMGQKILWSQEGTKRLWFFIIILIVVLIAYTIPYLVGTYIFSKTVIKKVRELEDEQTKEKIEFDRKKNLMLSDIAHDLRTPITTINGYAKAINDGMVTDEQKRREYLDIIQSKSKRMNDLIELLFEYIKLDSEGFKLQIQENNLTEILLESAAFMYTDIEDAGMELDIDIPEEPLIVSVDKIQFTRVITNLLVNAIRHNKANTAIRFAMKKYPGMVVIDIADNGQQIPENIRDSIFEPFSRGDESRSSKGGTGLGLSIAKKIVTMHGWEIGLNCNYEGYTKAFEIKIPIM